MVNAFILDEEEVRQELRGNWKVLLIHPLKGNHPEIGGVRCIILLVNELHNRLTPRGRLGAHGHHLGEKGG